MGRVACVKRQASNGRAPTTQGHEPRQPCPRAAVGSPVPADSSLSSRDQLRPRHQREARNGIVAGTPPLLHPTKGTLSKLKNKAKAQPVGARQGGQPEDGSALCGAILSLSYRGQWGWRGGGGPPLRCPRQTHGLLKTCKTTRFGKSAQGKVVRMAWQYGYLVESS